MGKELFFARHSESEANIRLIISNSIADYAPLTPKGREKALQLLDILKERATIGTIYTSPLARALEIAEIVASALPDGLTFLGWCGTQKSEIQNDR